MIKYDISLLGGVWSVLALSAGEAPRDEYGARSVYILPHPEADVCILSPQGTEWELSFLLSFYYRSLLGYPKCTLQVQSEGKQFDVEIFDTPHGMAGIKLDKCKLLSTITHTMPDLTEHTLHTVYSNGVYRVIPVTHAEGFRPSVLSALRVILGLPTATAAIGVTDSGVILDSDTAPTPALMAAAALCHPDFSRGEVLLSSCGVSYTLRDETDATAVYTPATLLEKAQFESGE